MVTSLSKLWEVMKFLLPMTLHCFSTVIEEVRCNWASFEAKKGSHKIRNEVKNLKLIKSYRIKIFWWLLMTWVALGSCRSQPALSIFKVSIHHRTSIFLHDVINNAMTESFASYSIAFFVTSQTHTIENFFMFACTSQHGIMLAHKIISRFFFVW